MKTCQVSSRTAGQCQAPAKPNALRAARRRRDELARELAEMLDYPEVPNLIDQVIRQTEAAQGARLRLDGLLISAGYAFNGGTDLHQAALEVAALEVAAIPEPRASVPRHLLARLHL